MACANARKLWEVTWLSGVRWIPVVRLKSRFRPPSLTIDRVRIVPGGLESYLGVGRSNHEWRQDWFIRLDSDSDGRRPSPAARRDRRTRRRSIGHESGCRSLKWTRSYSAVPHASSGRYSNGLADARYEWSGCNGLHSQRISRSTNHHPDYLHR